MTELNMALPQMLKALRSAKLQEEEFFRRQASNAQAEEALREECRRERVAAAKLWSSVQHLQEQIQAGAVGKNAAISRSPQGRQGT
eukprot:symbB.v1.2.018238.t1/scaffold1444.1/size126574/7